MLQSRIQNLPPSILHDSKLLTRLVQKLASTIYFQTQMQQTQKQSQQKCQQKQQKQQQQYTKKHISTYLNTFSFQAGFPAPNQQQINAIYLYLQDSKKQHITKNIRNKFMFFLKKCIHLYVQSKKQPIGGIIDRLVIILKNQMYREKEKQMIQENVMMGLVQGNCNNSSGNGVTGTAGGKF